MPKLLYFANDEINTFREIVFEATAACSCYNQLIGMFGGF